MSYSITGVAAITFPVHTLQSDAYSVPGSHRSIEPKSVGDLSAGVSAGHGTTPNKTIAQTNATAANTKANEVTSALKADTVTLSTADKVRSLQGEGESEQQIALTLDLPTKEVQSDLHISTAAHQSYTVAPVISSLSSSAPAVTG